MSDVTGADRKQKKQRWSAEQRAERIARFPLDRAGLVSLRAALERALGRPGCDHSLRHTEAWLARKGLEVEAARDAIIDEGGACDCEVLLNVEPDELFGADPDPAAAPVARPRAGGKAAPAPAAPAVDDGLVLGKVAKPWRELPAEPDASAVRALGKGADAPELRVLRPAAGVDEVAYCRERALWHLARFWRSFAAQYRQDVTAVAAQRWREDELAVGPPAVAPVGARPGRRYTTGSPKVLSRYVHWWLDLPDGPRVIELTSQSTRLTGDLKELDKLVAAATIAG